MRKNLLAKTPIFCLINACLSNESTLNGERILLKDERKAEIKILKKRFQLKMGF